jgi:hypothetical protein
MRHFSASRPGAAAVALCVLLALAACGGSSAPASAPGGGATPAPASAGSGGTTGGPLTGKRVCEIVTLDMATEILGEAPPRGEASDDRLAKSHTCAYKPGPKLIVQIQVVDGIATVDQFEALLIRLTEKTAVEGIGDKAYFIPRTEPPPGTRLYAWAKGYSVLVNIGSDRMSEDAAREAARTLAPTVIAAL